MDRNILKPVRNIHDIVVFPSGNCIVSDDEGKHVEELCGEYRSLINRIEQHHNLQCATVRRGDDAAQEYFHI